MKVMTADEFKIWAKKNNLKTYDTLGGFEIGQEVTYTNEYGVKFERKIVGFGEESDLLPGRCVYLDKDSYWFPVKLEEIK